MRLWTTRSCLLALCGSAFCLSAAEIRGTVFNADNRPLAQAMVFAISLDYAMGAKLPETRADLQGHFVLRVSTRGRHEVWAYNEVQGYPFVMGALWGKTNPPTLVNIRRRDGVVRDVIVHTGPRPGWIAGRVEPVPPKEASLRLELVDEPGRWQDQSATSSFRVAIPANIRVRVRVSAPSCTASEAILAQPPIGQADVFLALKCP